MRLIKFPERSQRRDKISFEMEGEKKKKEKSWKPKSGNTEMEIPVVPVFMNRPASSREVVPSGGNTGLNDIQTYLSNMNNSSTSREKVPSRKHRTGWH
ncbi:hypothetical protein CEXT_223941 [Caerostris extrusa]|uniref:Uncharacterized protein n=1 Tax=Caerostris extrusa TaxID=172846 RepID=A0AAV4MUY2_CAEEX|nr:hypothetical protein CEXT_223941 [Caerostris extrusa]